MNDNHSLLSIMAHTHTHTHWPPARVLSHPVRVWTRGAHFVVPSRCVCSRRQHALDRSYRIYRYNTFTHIGHISTLAQVRDLPISPHLS